MRLLSSKRRIAATAAGLVLLLFLLRPGVSRLKSRIVGSISAALSRRVEISSVNLRLLPRPGFDLHNLVVYDDPAFGAEPMLRAGEVAASLRVVSLMRGRLEIARLDLTEPSLNLVHGDNGRWNLEALLERAAQSPLAPTSKAKSEARPAFPYIEVSSGRINFKYGNEKKPYALVNADFALWQESENTWGVRLKAQPFRSDLNLSDVGLLRLNGKWQRAPTLRETPLELSAEWDRAQLGQLTKLFGGADKGWRGTMLVGLTLAGTPSNLKVTSDVSVSDFRRYDIPNGAELRLAAHCGGSYSSVDHVLHEVKCAAPAGSGTLAIAGETGLPGSHSYDLVISATDVPASSLAAAALHAKKSLPEDLAATGVLNGKFAIRRKNQADFPHFEGKGEITNLRVASASNDSEIAVARVPLAVRTDSSKRSLRSRRNGLRLQPPDLLHQAGTWLEIGPFSVAAGRASDAQAQAWVGRAGYGVSVAGDADIARALRLGKMFGLPALTAASEGAAQLDLQIAGSWTASRESSGFLGPQVTGRARLQNVRAEVRGADGPIGIATAEMELLSDRVRVTRVKATAANTAWSGSLEMPRGCGAPGTCVVQFALKTDEIALGDLSRWAAPNSKKRPWYGILSPATQGGPSFIGGLRAAGHITAGRLHIHGLTASRVSGDVSLDAGKLRISDLKCELSGGKHRGEWLVDFTSKPAQFSGSGELTQVSLSEAGAAMKDAWIAGIASGSYRVSASGASAPDLWKSAEGTVDFDLREGGFPHLLLVENADSLKVKRFHGRAHLSKDTVEIKDAQLDSSEGAFEVSGTATLERELDLKLSPSSGGGVARASRSYGISGTLENPEVTQIATPEAHASLKQ